VVRKASVGGLAAAAVASGLLMASPVHAQSRTATPAGAVAGAAGNLVPAIATSDGEGRRRERDVTSVGGVGNVTGSERARGGVSRSRISNSGNVSRTRVGMRERPRFREERPRFRMEERPRFRMEERPRFRMEERPRFREERPRFPSERTGTNISNRNENVTSVGGVGNVTGSAGAQGGVRGSTIRGSGNVSGSQIGTERERSRGEETTSVGGVGNVTGSPGASGGVSGSTVENSGNVSGSTIE
jgi:hypothetical protein